jgi:hypothetical protein
MKMKGADPQTIRRMELHSKASRAPSQDLNPAAARGNTLDCGTLPDRPSYGSIDRHLFDLPARDPLPQP